MSIGRSRLLRHPTAPRGPGPRPSRIATGASHSSALHGRVSRGVDRHVNRRTRGETGVRRAGRLRRHRRARVSDPLGPGAVATVTTGKRRAPNSAVAGRQPLGHVRREHDRCFRVRRRRRRAGGDRRRGALAARAARPGARGLPRSGGSRGTGRCSVSARSSFWWCSEARRSSSRSRIRRNASGRRRPSALADR